MGAHRAAPALIVVIDEYAELADEARHRDQHADSIARRGRAVAVTLLAATQRPTQKAMGSGAVRSQMDVRICLRVRERRDVDLILGQGMLAAGWAADTLNAPGKFLISTPEHTTPRRARAYRVTDHDVATIAARYAAERPHLDGASTPTVDASGRPDRSRRPDRRLRRSGVRALDGSAERARRGQLGQGPDGRHRQGPNLGLRPAANPRRRRPRHPVSRGAGPSAADRPGEQVVRADVRGPSAPLRAGARDGRTSARTSRGHPEQGRRRSREVGGGE